MTAGRRPLSGRLELRVGLCLLAAIVGVGATLAVRRSTPVEPGLVVAAGALDFGSAWEQPAYRHVFAVSNPTGGPIAVTEFATGCGCTTVEPRTFTVPPGGTQKLTATLDLTNRAGESGAEFLVDLLPTLAHQPPGERTVWTLRGDVRLNPIELSPSSLDFGDAVIVGELPASQDLTVSLADDAPFDDLRAKIIGESGDAELTKMEPRSWTLAVTPRAGLPIGRFEFVVRLEATSDGDATGAKPRPFRDIEVTGVVRDDIAAWPSSLSFGALELGETGEEYVVLASHRKHPFEVERIETPAGVTVAPAEQQLDDGSKTFVVQQAATAPGDQKGEIQFHARRGDSSEAERERVTIRLPLSFYGTQPPIKQPIATITTPAAPSRPDEAAH